MPADIAIRGAGPVGCVLALLLDRIGRSVLLTEHRTIRPSALRSALRPLALSHASRLILERVGAWAGLAPTPIQTVHVSQQGCFGRARLSAADAGVPALGYVVDYGLLLRALLERLDQKAIRVRTDPAEARLVVHAEGAAADATEKDYGQEALVALVATEPHAGGTAWERFTPGGPLALLPLGARFGLVWGLPAERARELCEAPEADFLAALSLAFGRRAGAFVSVEGRNRVPLALRVRPTRIAPRQAFIGNAAQTLHPVAGQGLNLGLRDAWDLARVLRDAEDPGEARVLHRFAQARCMDAAATVRTTDFLARAFLGGDPLTGMMRGIGLSALDICLPARRFFARRMIFGASALP